MESEDKKPIFTKRLILTVLAIILIILIILLLLRRCGSGNNKKVTEVTISPLVLNLEPGESRTLTAVTSSGTAQVYWTAQDDTCVTVTGSGTEAVVTALSRDCYTVVTVRTDDGATAECPVTVAKSFDKLEAIQLNKSTYTVYVGKSVLASVSPAPTTAQLPDNIYYSIEDTTIATVNENGVIKGVKVGTTTLKVTTDVGIGATATVKVIKKTSQEPEDPGPTHVDVTGLDFNGSNDTYVCVGKQTVLGYKVKPNNASEQRVDWQIENPTDKEGMANQYASLSSEGYVTGISPGRVTITITSKENSNIFATTQLDVISASDSRCKDSGTDPSGPSGPSGPSDPHTPSTPSTPGGPSEGEVSTAGMKCTVSYKKSGDYYTRFVVTWSFTPGISDDGYSARSYCINGSCTRMTSNTHTYSAPSGSASQKFGFSYVDKNGKTVTGNCNPYEATKVDSQAPTCNVTASKVENGYGKIKVTINGSDDFSGVKKMSLNEKNFSSYSTPQFSISESVEVTLDKAKIYSGIVYDDAGNKGTCLATVNPDGSIEESYYIKSVTLLGPSSMGHNEEVAIKGHFYDSTNKKIAAQCSDFSVNGTADWQCTSTGITIRSVPSGTKTVTVTLSTNNTTDGKTLSKTLNINVTDLDTTHKYKVYCPVNGEKHDNYYVGNPTVSCYVEVEGLTSGEYKADVKVCATVSGTCTPNKGSVTLTENGTNKIYYKLTSKDLGDSSGFHSYVSLDNSKPTCSVSRNKDGKYMVRMDDIGSGIKSYKIGDGNLVSGNGSVFKNVVIEGAVSGTTVYLEDKAGNTGSCSLGDATNVRLVKLHLSKTNVVLAQDESSTVYATAWDSQGRQNSSMNGITVSGGSGCFSVNANGMAIYIKAAADKTCTASQVVVTSTYDNEIKAYFDVTVLKASEKMCTFNVQGDKIKISASRTDSKVMKTVINGYETTSVNYNEKLSYSGIVYYADGNTESCKYGAVVSPSTGEDIPEEGDRPEELPDVSVAEYKCTMSFNKSTKKLSVKGETTDTGAKIMSASINGVISSSIIPTYTGKYTGQVWWNNGKTAKCSYTIDKDTLPIIHSCSFSYSKATKTLTLKEDNTTVRVTNKLIQTYSDTVIVNPAQGIYYGQVSYADGETAKCSYKVTSKDSIKRSCSLSYNKTNHMVTLNIPKYDDTFENYCKIQTTDGTYGGNARQFIARTNGTYGVTVEFFDESQAYCSITIKDITEPIPVDTSKRKCILSFSTDNKKLYILELKDQYDNTKVANATISGPGGQYNGSYYGANIYTTIAGKYYGTLKWADGIVASCSKSVSTFDIQSVDASCSLKYNSSTHILTLTPNPDSREHIDYTYIMGPQEVIGRSMTVAKTGYYTGRVQYTNGKKVSCSIDINTIEKHSCSATYDRVNKRISINATDSTNVSTVKVSGASIGKTFYFKTVTAGTYSIAVNYKDGTIATCSANVTAADVAENSCTLTFNSSTKKLTVTGNSPSGASVKSSKIHGYTTTQFAPTAAGTYIAYVDFSDDTTATCKRTLTNTDLGLDSYTCKFQYISSTNKLKIIGETNNSNAVIRSAQIDGYVTSQITPSTSKKYTGKVYWDNGATAECSKDVKVASAETYSCSFVYNYTTKKLTINGSTTNGSAVIQKTVINGRETSSMSNPKSGTYRGAVYWNNGKSATCSKEIAAVPTITISGTKSISTSTGTTTLEAKVENATGVAYYNWTSSNVNCATVSSTTSGKVTVTGKNAYSYTTCTTTITVYAKNQSGIEIVHGSATVTVAKAPAKATLSIGGTKSINATGTTKLTASVSNVTTSVAYYNWSASGACTVSSTTSGTVTVTGTNTTTSAKSCTVTAIARTQSGTKIVEGSATVSVGGVSKYSCSVDFTGSKGTVYANVNYKGNQSHAKSSTFQQNGNTTSSAAVSGPGTYRFTVYWDDSSSTQCSGELTQAKYDSLKSGGAEDFACGTIAGANTTWTNQPVTIKVTCTGKDCAATYNQTSAQYTASGIKTVTTVKLKVTSLKGNTKECGPYNVYYDGGAPTCTTSGGSTTWTSSNREITYKCSDTGSGCQHDTVKSTFSTTTKTYKGKYVFDKAGNSVLCPEVNVYVDKTSPKLTCTITTNNSSNGVTIKRVFSDDHSGLSSGEAAGVSRTLTDTYKTISTQTFTATDGAGNKKTCSVKITSTTTTSCPSGSVEYDTSYCRKTSGGVAPTICSVSGYTYNSSTGKCEKSETKYHSGSTPTCGTNCGNPNTSGCTGSSSGVTCNWSCTCKSTLNPGCPSNRVGPYSGYCYEKVAKTSTKTYHGELQ